MKKTFLTTVIGLSAILSVPAFADTCESLSKQIDDFYKKPEVQQCDGSREGKCKALWAELEALYDRFDDLECEDQGQSN